MISPDAPPTCPDPALTVPMAAGIIEGAGPNLAQSARARAFYRSALTSDAKRNGNLRGGGVRYNADSLLSPQPIPTPARIDNLVIDTSLGVDLGSPRLPGRIPPTVWDGEPRQGAPNVEQV
jgi:hypothetical protein